MPSLTEIRSFLDARGFNPKSFPDILRGIRLYMGWKPWEAAEVINASESTWKRTEKGLRPLDHSEANSLGAAIGCKDEFVDVWLGRTKFSTSVRNNWTRIISYIKKKSPVRSTQTN